MSRALVFGAVAAMTAAAMAGKKGSRAANSPEWSRLYLQAETVDLMGGGLGDRDAMVTLDDSIPVWHGQGLGGTLSGLDPLMDRTGVGRNVNHVGRFLTSERSFAAEVYGSTETTARFRVPPGRYAVFEPHGPNRHALGGDSSQMPRSLLPIDPALMGREILAEAVEVKRRGGGDWHDMGSLLNIKLRNKLWVRNPDYVRRLASYYLDRGYQGFVWRDWLGDSMIGDRGAQDVWVILGGNPVHPEAQWGSASRQAPIRAGFRGPL